VSTRRPHDTPSADAPPADSTRTGEGGAAVEELPVFETGEGQQEPDGAAELIAAAFQSLFDLSFDGRPHWYGPNLAYPFDVAAASGFRLMSALPNPPSADTAQEGERSERSQRAPRSRPGASLVTSPSWRRGDLRRACWLAYTTPVRWRNSRSCPSTWPAAPPTGTFRTDASLMSSGWTTRSARGWSRAT